MILKPRIDKIHEVQKFQGIKVTALFSKKYVLSAIERKPYSKIYFSESFVKQPVVQSIFSLTMPLRC